MDHLSRYSIDAWSVARTANPLEIVEALVDRTSRPGWSRDFLCRHCEHWTPAMGEHKRPFRPGAEPLESCSGCWYAALDDLAPELAGLELEQAHISQGIERARGRRRQELEARWQALAAAREARLQEPARRRKIDTGYAAIEWRDGRHHVVRDTA